jgi:hypothetical protein
LNDKNTKHPGRPFDTIKKRKQTWRDRRSLTLAAAAPAFYAAPSAGRIFFSAFRSFHPASLLVTEALSRASVPGTTVMKRAADAALRMIDTPPTERLDNLAHLIHR